MTKWQKTTKCYQDLDGAALKGIFPGNPPGHVQFCRWGARNVASWQLPTKYTSSKRPWRLFNILTSVRILQSQAFRKNTYTSTVNCQSPSIDQVYEIFTSNPVLTEQINTVSQFLLLKSWWLKHDCILALQTVSLILQITSDNQNRQTGAHETITPNSSRSSIAWQQHVSYIIFEWSWLYFICYYTVKE